MPFIKGLWVEPEKKIQQKQKIKPSQLNMRLLYNRPVGKTYRVVQEIILANGNVFDPRPIQMKNIDRRSFEDQIKKRIGAYDANYMKLVNYSTNKAVFDLDYKKWVNDALRDVRPSNRLSKFEQRFKLKKQLPKMIQYSTSMEFDKFLIRKFKEYMETNRKNRTWFEKFLPREISGKIRNGISHMFEYTYDKQSNTIIAKLKDIYIMGVLFAVGHTVDSKLRGKKLIDIDFEKSVKRKSKQFDRRKWESFIKKRFI